MRTKTNNQKSVVVTAADFEKLSSENSCRVHIIPNGDKWSVKLENRVIAYAVAESKEEAIVKARNIRSLDISSIVIHGLDGRITKHLKKKQARNILNKIRSRNK